MSKSTGDKKKLQTGPASLPAPSSKNFRKAVIGFVALDLAVIMTALLVLEKIGSIELPGCGPKSACAMAQSSAWGRVPLGSYEIPVSFIGLGYFAGMLAAWLIARGRLPAVLRAVAGFGAGISVLYLGVIVSQKHYCPYCIVTHLANFVFLAAVLISPRATISLPAPAITAAAIFLAVNIGGMTAKSKVEIAQSQKQESQREESVREIAKGTQPHVPAEVNTDTQADTPDKSDKPWKGPFTGRYRQGPEKAVYRIVMYTDYQCPDCYKVEKDIVQLMKTRSDISLSTKHFPFDASCNPNISQSLHPSACHSASIAEAAGVLRGSEGFWEMHHALFERQANSPPKVQGAFTTPEEYVQFLAGLGYLDQDGFEQIRKDPSITALIRSDCEEAAALGLYYTPMVFINGVELKGIFAPQAVSRTIAALDASKLEAKGPEDDNPPLAPERYVADWRESHPFRMPVDAMTFGRGPENAKIRIAVIGDYQEEGSINALREIGRLTAGRSDVRVDFRLFPFLRECNATLPSPSENPKLPQFPMACVAARAAKAAGMLGGVDAFWKMHEWLIQNSATVNDQTVLQAAAATGLDVSAFQAAMAGPQVQAAIASDATGVKNLLNKGIPTVRINDKVVPRWQLKGDNILERIIKEVDEAG